jgi:hypothetical protein
MMMGGGGMGAGGGTTGGKDEKRKSRGPLGYLVPILDDGELEEIDLSGAGAGSREQLLAAAAEAGPVDEWDDYDDEEL